MRHFLLCSLTACALTLLFWGALWSGYGFVGGDLYPYFFPQKAFYADRLHAGEFPLWNHLTGFGYPILGESQTGAAYPPHLVTYYLFDVNTAYNVEHLVHYVLCFVATWLFAHRIGFGTSGSCLTAVVFTYGWFPPRACLEWAIVTGAWLPMSLWCVESFLQTRWWRYGIGLGCALGLQLLAGHFHLAFITQLLVVAYGGWRLWSNRADTRHKMGSESRRDNRRDNNSTPSSIQGVCLSLGLAIVAGFSLAAVQLVPAWELKTRSSRAEVGREHDPAYGYLPPLYISQMFAPFLWYSPLAIDGDETIRTISELAAPWHWFGPHHDLESAVQQTKWGSLSTATNKIEAHLYCGLVPLGLAVWWLIAGRKRSGATAVMNSGPTLREGRKLIEEERGVRLSPVDETLFWMVVGTIALVYSTGWLLPVARYIPGFNFFRGPGRYGIVTTLACALMAGRGLDALVAKRQRLGRRALIGLVFWSTIGDLWLVSRMVTNVVMVPNPAISFRKQSDVRKRLLDEPTRPRLYCPGQNVGNLLGVSCLPVYLGIAPSEYADPKFAGLGMPKSTGDGKPLVADEEFLRWLRDSGVTHILSFEQLDEPSWQASLLWQGTDAMLNRAWGRSEPLWLYRLTGPGWVSLIPEDAGTTSVVEPTGWSNEVALMVESSDSATVLLRELAYPGWNACIDDAEASSSSLGMFRQVDVPEGAHRIVWTYRPLSVIYGAVISLLTALTLATLGHVRFWHREWLNRLMARVSISKCLSD